MDPRRYRIELVADFRFTVREVIEAPREVSREDLEGIIDRNWWWISGSTDVLLESSWQLQSCEELPGDLD